MKPDTTALDAEWQKLPLREKILHYPCMVQDCPRCRHLAAYPMTGKPRGQQR